MVALNKHVLCVCAVTILVLVAPVHNAPKSRNTKKPPATKFDQKQTGDYNIQVHLKDFQIVAVLGDDALGSYGDYDYYDYADLTIKPIIPLTTSAPQESSISSASTEVSSEKPQLPSSSTENSGSTTLKPSPNTLKPLPNTLKPSPNTLQPSPNTSKPPNGQKPPEFVTIKVEIVNDTVPISKPAKEKVDTPSKVILNDSPENPKKTVSIVPLEASEAVSGHDPHVPLGEIMHYRKCSEGYARDKRGRCRKIRRTPQLPFGITRFASNLAARFRQAASSEEEALSEIP